MFGLKETLPPVIEPPPGKSRGPARVVILFIIGCAVLEIPAYLLWKRSRRAETGLAALNEQSQSMRREVAQAQAQSGAALDQASRAQANAAQAAQQRDQAEQARNQSEQQAAQAQLDAAVAAQRANRAQQQAAQAQQEAASLRDERQAQLDHLQTVLARIASTRKTSSGLVVTLDSNAIRFDFDKSAIKPGNREMLSRMAGVLMTLQGYQIYVYGYTDNIGTDQYNQKLSERRADAVRDYLAHSGVDPKIMATKGYGKSDPLESGESARARAKNRRVEVGIVDSVLRMESEVPPS